MSRIINADELIADLHFMRFMDEDDRSMVYALIEKQPTIDQERKTGKWFYVDDDNQRYDTYQCSECRRHITVDVASVDDIGFTIEDMKYCPNCGSYNGDNHD